MERQRRKRSGSPETNKAVISQRKKTERIERSNTNRRNLYATDLAYKNDCKDYSRSYYRDKNGVVLETKLDKGLLIDPVRREIKDPFSDRMTTADVFSTGTASEALGKSRMTLLKWQKDGIVPEPRLEDSLRAYKYYSVGELKLIAKIVAKWEMTYKYLTIKNVEMVAEMNSRVNKYRDTKV